jgi:flagellar biosynthesis protein FlhF
MRLKSYFAGTVESAISLARQEMGEDAKLVSSRKTLPESRRLGLYEVVFAASQEPALEPAARAEAVKPPKTDQPSPALAQEMEEMRRQIAKVSAQVSRGARRSHRPANLALDDLDETLIAHEVDRDLAGSVLRKLEALSPDATPREVRQAFRDEIGSRIAVAPDLPRAVVVLVGPPGVGKTTMLAKLAVRSGLIPRRPTHIISYDSHRIASGDQLRAYAAILGVGFEGLYTVDGLAQSLRENVRKDLILIDTPGYSASDFELSLELSRFLSTYPHLDIHLVLSCAAKTSDLSCMVERYKPFHPAKLLFTMLDETGSYGAILNEPARTGLPISFLSAGPRVPDDLDPATKDRVADLLWGGREAQAIATA